MDEEKTTQEDTAKNTVKDTPKGSKQEAAELIKEARAERERMEVANQVKEDLLDREEALMSERILGGGAEAGGTLVKPRETDEEYADRVRRGEANPLMDDDK